LESTTKRGADAEVIGVWYRTRRFPTRPTSKNQRAAPQRFLNCPTLCGTLPMGRLYTRDGRI